MRKTSNAANCRDAEGHRYGGTGTQGDVGNEVEKEEGRDERWRGGTNGGRREREEGRDRQVGDSLRLR